MRHLPLIALAALLGGACEIPLPLTPLVMETRLVSDTNDSVGAYEVQALVRDLTGIAKVKLHYTGLIPEPSGETRAGTRLMEPMLDELNADQERFSGTIPGFPLGATVRYAIEACNNLDICITEPAGWPDQEAFAFVVGTLPSNPFVLDVSPARGPTAGGTRVEVRGEDFRPGMQVFFGASRAPYVEVLRTTLATCILPANPAGRVDVSVRNPDNQQATLRDAFFYYEAPEIITVTPDHGPTTGGTDVVIEGRFFLPDVRVTFEGRHARHVVVDSDTRLRCQTPPGNPGAADVAVIHPEGGAGVLEDGYHYIPPPRVDSVDPPEGPDFGGQTVTIHGDYFEQDATVTVGGNPCTNVTFVSAQILTCTVPAGTPGAADVTVTNQDGQSGTLWGGYFYNGPPVVISVDPPEGPIAAGEEVAVYGAGFLDGMQVFFAGVPVTVVGNVSHDRAVVKAPEAPAPLWPAPESGTRVVSVSVTNPAPDGRSAELPDAYTYVWPPQLDSLEPDHGPTVGGTDIVARGRFFRPINNSPITVAFDDVPCLQVTVVSTTELRLVNPPGDPGYANVTVRNHPHSALVEQDAYLYVPPPQPTRVVPPDGPTFGGETVTVHGSGFQQGAVVTIDGAPCGMVQVAADGQSLTCVTPPGQVGPADVQVTNPDGQSGTLTNGYTYVALLVRPPGGFTTGFTRTRLIGAGMHEGVQIFFGTTQATLVTRVSNREVVVESPPHPEGVVDVRFRNPDNTGEIAEDAFTYRVLATAASNAVPTESMYGNDGEAVDIDHDGDMDVVVANGFNEGDEPAAIYRNRGNGLFDINYITGPIFGTKTSVADVTGDGWEDVLIAATSTTLYFTNNGSGDVMETALPNTGSGAWDAQFVDLSGDGLKDIFLLNIGCPDPNGCSEWDGRDTYLVNTGGGRFEDRSSLVPHDDGLYHDHKFDTWDLDGDRRRDLIIVVDNKEFPAPHSSTHDNRMRVLLNKPQGFVETPAGDFSTLVGNVWGIAMGDLDGDGRADLALPNFLPNVRGPTGLLGNSGSAAVMMGGQGVSFRLDDSRLGIGRLNEDTGNAVMADLDQDGDLEIIYCNMEAPSRLFINKGDGTFVQGNGVLPSTIWKLGDVVAADFDGDGDTDLLLINAGQDVLLLSQARQ